MGKPSAFDIALVKEGVTGQLAELARSIYAQESNRGRNTRTSNAGAVGGMQVMPGTFAEVADKDWDISNPEQNARAGIRYLKQLDKKAGGDPTLIAAGYYGGPGAMEKARKGIAVSDPRNPHAPNTLQYAQQVVARMPGTAGVETPVVASAGSPVSADVPDLVLPEPNGPRLAEAVAPGSVVDPWLGFQQALPTQVQPEDLAFGQALPVPQSNPLAYLGQPVLPNFTAFYRWKGKV